MLEHILKGGYMMFPLVFLSILSFAVIVDRLRAFRTADVDTYRLRRDITDLLDQGKVDDAIRACESSSGPVAAVMLVGLDKFRKLVSRGRPATEIEVNVTKTMEDFAPHVLEALEKRMNILALIGTVSPLLGMTGTVTGMIASFKKMQESAGLDPGAVSGGISEALITTAAGLLIAIPSVVAYNVFTKKVDKFILEIDECTTDLIDYISLGYAKR